METGQSVLKKRNLRYSGVTVEGIQNKSFLLCSLSGVSGPTVQSCRALKQKANKTGKKPCNAGANALDYVDINYYYTLSIITFQSTWDKNC